MPDVLVDFFRQALSDAGRHAAMGEKHVPPQTELINKLERDGHDTTQAGKLLRQFEEIQVLHRQYRDRLRKELSEVEPRPDAQLEQ